MDHAQLTGVVLAGGKSERFGGDSALPKPAVLVNGTPLVIHAAAQMMRAGCTRIIVLTGANHARLKTALALPDGEGQIRLEADQKVTITLRFTGDETATGGRLAQLHPDELGGGALISYTDVFTDCDLRQLLNQRRAHSATLAILAVNPRQPWGALQMDGSRIVGFTEKPFLKDEWINGGIFAADATLLDAIKSTQDALEGVVIARLINLGAVQATQHAGWWRAVDTSKDRRIAQTDDLARFSYASGHAPRLTSL